MTDIALSEVKAKHNSQTSTDMNHASQDMSMSERNLTSKPEEDGQPKGKTISWFLAFSSLMMGVFVVSLDASSLSVAIPVITQALHGTTLEAFWANLSFLLAVVITQPMYNNISDGLGRKIPLYASFVLFFIGSVVFAVAQNMGTLIVGRIFQGLGGGGLDVLSEVILADMTSLKERPLYLGVLSLPMAGGGICGPLIGAAFSEYSSWRWLGWINIPFLVIGFLLAFFFMNLRPLQQDFMQKLRYLDGMGMLLLALGCTIFSLALSWAGPMYPWSSWKTIVPLIIGFLLLVLLGWYESRPAMPMFPYRIFVNKTAVVTIIGSTVHGIFMYSVLLYVPLFYQAVRLESPFKSAISMLPLGCSVIGFSILGAVGVEVIRRYRWGVIGSWVVTIVGVALWALWTEDSTKALTYGLQILGGAGIGVLFTILVIPMQASVEEVNDSGLAAGILVSFRLFGGLIGLSICSTVFTNIFVKGLDSIRPLPTDLSDLADVREIIAFVPRLPFLKGEIPDELFEVIVQAYRKAIVAVFATLAGIGAIGFVTSLWTEELTLEKEELGRQRYEEA